MADMGTRGAERAVKRLLDSVPESRRNAADARIVIGMAREATQLAAENIRLAREVGELKSEVHWRQETIDDLRELLRLAK